MECRERAGSGRSFAVASTILATLLALSAVASTPAPGDLEAVLQEMERQAPVLMARDGVPGMAFAVVKGDQVVYARGFGFRDKDASSGPVDEHTLFEIGSTTKAFNAAALGTVVDEGKVAWTDRVHDHLSDFKMNDPWVTRELLVEDLIAQRSGMPAYALDNMPGIGFNRADIRRATRLVDPVTSFRAKFGYQNCMHLWASDLIEKKTGLAWEEVVRQRILEPLGMSESTFDFDTYDANPNHARGHIVLDKTKPIEQGLWTIPPDWPYRKWIGIYAPAGGMMSSVGDMAKWVALQTGNGAYGGRVILAPETMAAIRAPRIYLGKDDIGVSSYAMGWIFAASPCTPVYWHNGQTPGFHSIVFIYTQGPLGLVVLTNQPDNRVPEDLARILLNRYFCGTPADASPGCPAVDPPQGPSADARKPAAAEAPAATIPFGKLVGTYENPAYGKVAVKRLDSGPCMTFGPDRVLGKLTAAGINTYTWQWPDWPLNKATVTFKADASGQVTKLIIKECADVKGGDFKRVGP
jgi:CubicO group peptidase (beta-lactamase class C family)